MNAKAKGYLLGTVAAATYGMNPLFALPLYKAGMDPDSVLFFRYLFAIPILGVMLKARGRDFGLRRREVLPLIVLGLLVALSSLTLFLSYNYMDAGIASTLLFVYPIFVALIMAFWFREKLSMQTALCILLALGGIALLYESGDGATLDLTGTILVMVSALSYAIYIVGGEPPGAEIRRDAQSDLLRLAVRAVAVLRPAGLRQRRQRSGSLVFMGESCRPGRFPDSDIVSLYDPRHPIHRFDSHGYSGSSRTRDGRIFRRGGFRGVLDSADRVRNFTDYRGRESYRRGEQDRVLPRAFPQVVPAAALESERLP